MESAVQLVRLVQYTLLASIAVYGVVGELLGRTHTPGDTYSYVAFLVAISILGATLVVRRTLVLPSEELLNRKPDDSLAIAHWRTGYLFLYALCELLGLTGLALRLLGFPLSQVFIFYMIGFLLLLLFSPRPSRRNSDKL